MSANKKEKSQEIKFLTIRQEVLISRRNLLLKVRENYVAISSPIAEEIPEEPLSFKAKALRDFEIKMSEKSAKEARKSVEIIDSFLAEISQEILTISKEISQKSR